MNHPDNCILVIFGASGDLTKRKLIPALFKLYQNNLLPERFAVLGVSRAEFSDQSFRQKMTGAIPAFLPGHSSDQSLIEQFGGKLFYQSIDTLNPSDYHKVKTRLGELDRTLGIGGRYVYYLSTPPSLYGVIPEYLGAQGLNQQGDSQGWKRLIIEKPFGYDLESSKSLNQRIQKHFHEDQIYRIDHYLGKETVQNILAFRFANGIFEPLWNRNYIHHVEITAAESIGIETRGRYYDQSGAMRDMVQNHLLQVLGTMAMEPPALFDASTVRNETVKVFQALCPIPAGKSEEHVVRGQYTPSMIDGKKVLGYREEENVDPESRTETFVAMKLFIDNWRWGDIPFFIRTGKRMPERVTEVVIHFRKTPHVLFKDSQVCDAGCNQLVIRIQPDEGILLKFGMKTPGSGFRIKNVSMDFHYSDLADSPIPEAYERLLLDCMLGDATLYARADAVEACWAFVTPLLDEWRNNPHLKLYGYPAGSWGPKEARQLFDDPAEDWRYPCKSLVTAECSGEL